MIWESKYWKKDLLRIAARLEKRMNQRNNRESAQAAFEREIFIAFYAVRKLVEAKKVSDRIRDQKIEVVSFGKAQDRVITFWNAHRIDKNFELERFRSAVVPLRHLYNEVIHSYIFTPSTNSKGALRGFFLASDRNRNVRLLYVELRPIIRILRQVGRNYPSHMRSRFDERLQDYVMEID